VVPCWTAITERLSPASTVTTLSATAGSAVVNRVATMADTTRIHRPTPVRGGRIHRRDFWID